MLSRLHRDQSGFTLVELLVSMVLLTVVGSAVVGGIVSALRVTAMADHRIEAMTDVQTALARIGRNVRVSDARDVEGGAIVHGSPTRLTVDVFRDIDGITRRRRITYEVKASTQFPGRFRLEETELVWNDPTADTMTVSASYQVDPLTVIDGLVIGAEPVFGYYRGTGTCLTGCDAVTAPLTTTQLQEVAEIELRVRRDTRHPGEVARDLRVSTRVTLRNAR